MIKLTSRLNDSSVLDWSEINLDEYWGKPPQEWYHLKLFSHGEYIPLADIFEITFSDDHSEVLEIHPGRLLIHGLGTCMKKGKIILHGNAGDKTAASLAGGEIVVNGETRDYAAQGMKKGKLIVTGSAGDYLGAPFPGVKTGMRGGEIYIGGSVGHMAGLRMRRGMILIKGSTGRALAEEMFAGTIIVGNFHPENLGSGIRRGSIVSLNHQPDHQHPGNTINIKGFTYASTYQPVWWRIFAVQILNQKVFSLNQEMIEYHFHRYSGDKFVINKAEILIKT